MNTLLLAKALQERLISLQNENPTILPDLEQKLDNDILKAIRTYYYTCMYFPVQKLDKEIVKCLITIYPNQIELGSTFNIIPNENAVSQAKSILLRTIIGKKNYFPLNEKQLLTYALIVSILEFVDIINDVEQQLLRLQNQERYFNIKTQEKASQN